MDYSSLHKKTYDALAPEYEDRVKALLPVTRRAVNHFARYIKPGGSILDVGCAVGTAISVLSKRGFKVTGIEISPKMAAFAKERNPNAKIIVGDFLKTRFDQKFDGILAFAFIHLFPKTEAVKIVKKMKSTLKPGGIMFLSSTKSVVSREGWETKEDYRLKRKRFRKSWTEEEMRGFINNMGLKVLALHKFKDPFGKIWMDFIAQKIV